MQQEHLINAVARMEELLAELRVVPATDILSGLELASDAPMMRPLVVNRLGYRSMTLQKMARAVIALQSTLAQIERQAPR